VVDWTQFKTDLERTVDLKKSLKTATELDQAVHYFTTTVQKAVWNNTTPHNKQHNRPHIAQLIQQKQQARHIWQGNRYPSDKRILNALTRQLTDELANYRETDYRDCETYKK
jgi:hypothetical protein